MKTKTASVRLPKELYEEIDNVCDDIGCSRNDWIKDALKDKLREQFNENSLDQEENTSRPDRNPTPKTFTCKNGNLYENGKVNTENASVKDGEYPTITGFGVKFYYDPAEYSRDSFSYDRWELIRDFKENKHFQEIHTSLNSLIAFIESQNR